MPPVLAVDLNSPGSYVHWNIFTVSVANLVLVCVMVVIFGAALLVPFPGSPRRGSLAGARGAAGAGDGGGGAGDGGGGEGSDGSDATMDAQSAAEAGGTAPDADPTMWTARLRRAALRRLPPGKLLPDSQPAYVASWIYVFGVAALAALGEGDIKVAITQSSAAWYLAAKDPTLRVALPKPSFALPSVLVVAAGISPQEKAAAVRFIRFAMQPDIQRLRIGQGEGDSYYWPLTTDAPHPKAGMPALGTLSIRHLDPSRWGPIEPQVNQWFSQAVVGQ